MRLSATSFSVRIGEATLDAASLQRIGGIRRAPSHLAHGLPGQRNPSVPSAVESLYRQFPPGQESGRPAASRVQRYIATDEKRIDIDGWVGSQNHNWGYGTRMIMPGARWRDLTPTATAFWKRPRLPPLGFFADALCHAGCPAPSRGRICLQHFLQALRFPGLFFPFHLGLPGGNPRRPP